ncbi:GNAT family N-acetyltransferase [Virgibacillus sp. W0430]|uniref:GNAT family N-acetyltransferase n=1 Tax=Virgibacillus sp. W0430 TaxID=3391580 RepID=UPI003F466428
MGITIRRMRKSDIKSVQSVAKESWATTYKNSIPVHIQEKFLQSAYNDSMMIRRMELSLFLVAEVKEQERIIGYANFSPVRAGGKVELSAIYILAAYQGRGTGSALFDEGIKILGADIKEIYLNVEAQNNIGKSFYLKKGFEVIQQFKEELDGHYLTNLRMVLICNESHEPSQ